MTTKKERQVFYLDFYQNKSLKSRRTDALLMNRMTTKGIPRGNAKWYNL